MHTFAIASPPAQVRRSLAVAAAFAAVLWSGGGCQIEEPVPPGRTLITAWFHSGRESERQTIEDQVRRFNAAQDKIFVRANRIPEGTYNGQVQAAAVAGDLPDVLELDGPFAYNYAWQQHLRPLDALLSPTTKEGLLRSILEQGTYRGRLYTVGTFDSGLGLYGRRSRLEAAGARIPNSPEEAWTSGEFTRLLRTLAEQDRDGAVLDLKLNYEGEWYAYAFSPLLQSAGGDLIDRNAYQSAQGRLNGSEAAAAMAAVQDWIVSGVVDPNLDDAAFTLDRVPLSLSGHWDYHRYQQAWGDDLVLLPMPDFGQGSRTGQGSWCWGISTRCQHPEAAAAFLEFLLRPAEVLAMANANGAVPATHEAIAASPLYREDGPLHLFVRQLSEGYAVPRPRTPAYPAITAAFQDAFADIRNGAPVQQALNEAAAAIDLDIADNQGYPVVAQPGTDLRQQE